MVVIKRHFYYNSCNRNCVEPYQWYNPSDWTLKSTCEKDKKTIIDNLNKSCQSANEQLRRLQTTTCPPQRGCDTENSQIMSLNSQLQSANEKLSRLQATTCVPQRGCPTCSCDNEKNEITRLKSENTLLKSENALLKSYINPVDKKDIYTINSNGDIQFTIDRSTYRDNIEVQTNKYFWIFYNGEYIKGRFFLTKSDYGIIKLNVLYDSGNSIEIGNSFIFNNKQFTLTQHNGGAFCYHLK